MKYFISLLVIILSVLSFALYVVLDVTLPIEKGIKHNNLLRISVVDKKESPCVIEAKLAKIVSEARKKGYSLQYLIDVAESYDTTMKVGERNVLIAEIMAIWRLTDTEKDSDEVAAIQFETCVKGRL